MPRGAGQVIRDAIHLSGQERCIFSARCELLVSKFGRSSKPMPRILVLTPKAIYIVVQQLLNNQLQISAERTIPNGAVKFISTSTLRDDWFAIGVGSPQEPDPLINCVFKTEFFLQFKTVSPGGMNLRIGDTLEYNKKPGKLATVKVLKDPSIPRDDMYKSGTVHVGQGESPNSASRPTPKGKAVVRPITTGKLLRPGGPGGQPSKVTSRPKPAARPIPVAAAQNARPIPTPVAAQVQRPIQTPAAAVNGASTTRRPVPVPAAETNGHARNESSASSRVPPPPPPPPPMAAPAAVPEKPQVRVKYDFDAPAANQLTIKAGEVLELTQKENNGWWLCKNTQTGAQGWTPAAYVEEIEPARAALPPPPPPPPVAPARTVPTVAINGNSAHAQTTAGRPTPPLPPVKRPVSGARKPAPNPPARDSAVSLGTGSGTDSGRATPNSIGGGSLAGGLAEALRARQSAMGHKKDDEDDDW